MRSGLAFLGTTLGGLVGYWLGDIVGFMTACFASVIGTAVGLYVARVVYLRYEDYLG